MNNLSPKEIYDQKKQERLGSEKKLEQFGKFKKLFVWFLVILIIGGGIYWFTKRSWEKISERKIYAVQISDQGRNHIDIGALHPAYNSNPPTSGPHYGNPAEKGIYKKELTDEQLVHNLEHGYIWISYRLDTSLEIIKQLESFYGFGKKIIIEPRAANDKIISLVAWNWLDKFDPASGDSLNDVELKRIGDFIDQYINQGPEPNAP